MLDRLANVIYWASIIVGVAWAAVIATLSYPYPPQWEHAIVVSAVGFFAAVTVGHAVRYVLAGR